MAENAWLLGPLIKRRFAKSTTSPSARVYALCGRDGCFDSELGGITCRLAELKCTVYADIAVALYQTQLSA